VASSSNISGYCVLYCVLQRCIDVAGANSDKDTIDAQTKTRYREAINKKVLENINRLIQDEFGNLVVQYRILSYRVSYFYEYFYILLLYSISVDSISDSLIVSYC
jgi:hypothetical protein